MKFEDQPEVLQSAHRHGVASEDMFHALANERFHVVQDDDMVMVIGPARDGELIEVGIVEWYGALAIVHAMKPARAKYLR